MAEGKGGGIGDSLGGILNTVGMAVIPQTMAGVRQYNDEKKTKDFLGGLFPTGPMQSNGIQWNTAARAEPGSAFSPDSGVSPELQKAIQNPILQKMLTVPSFREKMGGAVLSDILPQAPEYTVGAPGSSVIKKVPGQAPSIALTLPDKAAPPNIQSIFDKDGRETKVIVQQDGSYKPIGGAKANDEETWSVMTPDQVTAAGLPEGNYKRSNRGNVQTVTTPQQERIPQGFRLKSGGSGDLEFIPGGPSDPNMQSPTQKQQLGKIEADSNVLLSSLDNFGKAIDEAQTGDFASAAAGGLGPGGQRLKGAWTSAALMAKGQGLYELGVLSGPDMEVIKGALKDPGSGGGQIANKGAYKEGIQQVRDLVNTRLNEYRKNLGSPAQRAAPTVKGGGSVQSASPQAIADELRKRGIIK